jgi:PAS domain S-box-containing protein
VGEHEGDTTIRGETVASDTLRPLFDDRLDDQIAWGIVDAAPDGIVVADETGAILLVNRQAEELFGYDRGELLGRSVDDLLPEQFRQVHRAHRTRYRAEPRTRAMGVGQVLFGRRQDGSEFPVEISLSPLTTGGELRIIAVVRDVSDRAASEEEARRIREILDATRDAVLILDADSLRFTYVNQGAVDQVGYSAEELSTMNILHIAPDFDESRVRDLLAPLARGDVTSLMFTTVHRHRDGTDIPVEIILQATDVVEGRPRAFVEIVRDIRERLADEQRLRAVEQDLKVLEDRDRIARDLHDLVIQRLFAVGLAVQGSQARSTDAETTARLSGVVDELDETIREIRSVIFSLQNAAAAGPAPGLRAEVLRVIAEERELLGFEPRVQFDGVIDAVSHDAAAQLLASLREALSNVGRHAQASSVLVTLTAGTDLVLVVEDDGVGIPDEPVRGNGIDNISRRAMELGGTCEIAAKDSGGTRVRWSVPISS